MSRNEMDRETGIKKSRRQKPPIWTDGRQAPRFDGAAFLRASNANARHLAQHALISASAAVRRAAASFRDGSWRLPPERLGHIGRYLPDHRTMAQVMANTAVLASAAGDWVAGPAPATPFPGWDAPAANEPTPPPAPSPLRYVRPPRAAAATHPVEVDQETLHAIRTVVHAANVMPVRLMRVPVEQPEPPPAPPEPRAALLPELEPAAPTPPGLLFRAATATLGGAALAALWPAGAVQALFAHLRGEDLRETP